MTDTAVLTIVTDAVTIATRLLAPILLSTLAVGVVVSLLQTVTQIQEQTLTFVPKLFTVGAILVLGGNWMMSEAVTYVRDLWQGIPALFS